MIKIHGIYPNPFVNTLKIFFTLKVDSTVNVKFFNVAGEVIHTQELGPLPRGVNIATWDGVNNAGARVASGIYIFRLEGYGLDGSQDAFWDTVAITR